MLSSILQFLNKIKNLEFLIYLITIVTSSILVFVLPLREWEDYSITYKGAVLLAKGYIPYTDFGIPTGIGNYLLPTIFIHFFGESYNTLYALQITENILILWLSFRIISILTDQKFYGFNIILYFLLFFLTFIIKVKIDFYNSSFLLYQLGAFYAFLKLISSSKNKILLVFILSIFTHLVIQVKQDFGLLNFAIITAVFLLYSYKNRTFKYFSIFISLNIIYVLCYIYYYGQQNIFYWISFGQDHQPKREVLLKIVEIFSELKYTTLFILLILYVYSHYKTHSFQINLQFYGLILILGFSIQNTITLKTSNFPYLDYCIPLLFVLSLDNYFIYNKWKMGLIMFLGWGFALYKTIPLNLKASYMYNHWGSQKMANSPLKIHGISKVNKLDSINDSKIIDILHVIENKKKKPLNLCNATTIPFEFEVNSDLNYQGLPIWFDDQVSLFEREKNKMINLLKNNYFDAIIILKIENYPNYTWFLNEFYKCAIESGYENKLEYPLDKYENQRSHILLVKKD